GGLRPNPALMLSPNTRIVPVSALAPNATMLNRNRTTSSFTDAPDARSADTGKNRPRGQAGIEDRDQSRGLADYTRGREPARASRGIARDRGCVRRGKVDAAGPACGPGYTV